MSFQNKKFITIAKRENNTKRKYLIVNPRQGKHIPVSPSQALSVFEDLARLLTPEIQSGKYRNEKILFIGFAETATAIGAGVSVFHKCPYIQTTREIIPDAKEYLFFSEEHSHATEQKLVKDDIDSVINETDRIIFVEDEVTTGKTILNIINVMKKTYKKELNFSVLSILNGMSDGNLSVYKNESIDLFFLEKIDNTGFEEIAESFQTEGDYFKPYLDRAEYKSITCTKALNARRLTNGLDYLKACMDLAEQVKEKCSIASGENILVLGTEEFMFPAIYTGKIFEEMGNTVKTHSTTRSPISVYKDAEYPLMTRFELLSLYDKNRRTFIYNLKAYDKVIIITDSSLQEQEGVISLVNAAGKFNSDITVVRWQ